MREEFNSIRAEFSAAKAELDKLKAQVREKSKQVFQDGAKILFELYPDLEDISWTQYTSYWNDGDACYFSAHTDYFYVNGECIEDLEEESPLIAASESIAEFLNIFGNEDFEFMFGDHSRVTLTRESVFVEEYTSHD